MIVGNYVNRGKDYCCEYDKVESYVCSLIKSGRMDEVIADGDTSWHDIFCRALKNMQSEDGDVEIIPCSTNIIAKYFKGTKIANEVYKIKIQMVLEKMK